MSKEEPTGRAVGGKGSYGQPQPRKSARRLQPMRPRPRRSWPKLARRRPLISVPSRSATICSARRPEPTGVVLSQAGRMTEAIGMKGRGPGVVRIADHKLIRAYGGSQVDRGD